MNQATRLVCAGCGWVAPVGEAYPFRCPRSGSDDGDHVLRRELQPAAIGDRGQVQVLFLDEEENPFLRYRRLFHAFNTAIAGGLEEADWIEAVGELDGAVARVDGHGFRVTPFEPSPQLAARLGVASLRVKEETGNVSGSHKARHMMGLALWLEMVRRLGWARGDGGAERPLAVASCGNAALAAAVVAKAAGRAIEVFIPPDAEASVVERLSDLEALLTTCRREGGEQGDPCYLRFRDALARDALPFTCQGNENGLVIEGGQTLAWEMTSVLLKEGEALDHLVVQVGGGALASACIQGLEDARALGVLDRMPRIHTVQTSGAWPLRRAWDRLAARIAGSSPGPGEAEPGGLARRDAVAREIYREASGRIGRELAWAARHRSGFMWPWEEAPRSVARGILDDETYDWLAVVEGMLLTGGLPVVAPEETLEEAQRLAAELTGSPVDATGAAGLAGCLELQRAGLLAPEERVAVLFTGASR